MKEQIIDSKKHVFYDEDKIVEDIQTNIRFEILNKQYVFIYGPHTGKAGVARSIFLDQRKKGLDSVYVVINTDTSKINVPFNRYWEFVEAVPLGRAQPTAGRISNKNGNNPPVKQVGLEERKPREIDIYKEQFGLDLIDEDEEIIETSNETQESQEKIILEETNAIINENVVVVIEEKPEKLANEVPRQNPVSLILDNTKSLDEIVVTCNFPMNIANRMTHDLLVNTFGKEIAFDGLVDYYIEKLNVDEMVLMLKQEIKRNINDYYNGSTSLQHIGKVDDEKK